MSQPAAFSDCCGAPRQCLSRMTKTKQDNRQKRLRCNVRMDTGLPDKRVLRIQITKCQRLFQMRSGRGKPAGKHQVSPEGLVSQNEPVRIVALTAQTQQIFVQATRQMQFAANRVIKRLSIGNLKELGGGTQLLPQLSCAAKRLSRFGCRVAFNGLQDGAQGSTKFELLAPACEILRQQRQLVQPLLELRGCLRHRRTRDGPPSGLAP